MKFGQPWLLRGGTARRAAALSSLVAVAGALTLSLNVGGEAPGRPAIPPPASEHEIMGPPAPRSVHRWEVNAGVRSWDSPHRVHDFYTSYTGNPEITSAILELSLELDLPVNLAFALAWAESRYNPKAVSKPNLHGTRDWGLFQLNDGGRPEWSREEFFDVSKNTAAGLRFLRACLDEMGSIKDGLAAYNAGVYGVRQWGIPESTKHHIRAIVAYENVLDGAFSRRFPQAQLLIIASEQR